MMNKSAKELGDDTPDHQALLDVQIMRYLETFSKLVKKGRTIFDVGCGDGKPADEYLVRAGFAVNGIDPSPQKVELAKKNVPEGFFEVKDVSDLRQAEYCVDGVVPSTPCFRVPAKAIKEYSEPLLHLCQTGERFF
jgi:2-polyprenyl-3-methyl-5-hydroxy-6-metoxy-1,4-benzoquinol methylase